MRHALRTLFLKLVWTNSRFCPYLVQYKMSPFYVPKTGQHMHFTMDMSRKNAIRRPLLELSEHVLFAYFLHCQSKKVRSNTFNPFQIPSPPPNCKVARPQTSGPGSTNTWKHCHHVTIPPERIKPDNLLDIYVNFEI